MNCAAAILVLNDALAEKKRHAERLALSGD